MPARKQESPRVTRLPQGRPPARWWGLVEPDRWTEDVERRALDADDIELSVTRDVDGAAIAVTLRWPATDLDDALRRISDAIGRDPIDFRLGYPLPL
jgi:hypothetical protein